MKVSVIVATYNQRSTIARALDSVLAQQAPDFDFEVIIGDDCSTDGTADVCRQYAAANPGKVRLIAREKNLGVQANYFDCVQQARGEYLADCAGDDQWLSPRKLAMQVAMLNANPAMTLCHTAWVCCNAADASLMPCSNPYTGPQVAPKGSLLVPALRHQPGSYVHLCSAMWRRAPLVDALSRNPDLYLNPCWMAEDLQITSLMAATGSIGYIPEVTMAYTVGGKTISSEEDREKSFRFSLATTRLVQALQEHYAIAPADLADFYSARASHLFTLAFGLVDAEKCRQALDIARQCRVGLSLKAKVLRFLTISPLTWRPIAALLKRRR